MVVYLDDMLFLHQRMEELIRIRELTLNYLEGLGFLANYEKSELQPTIKLTFLGFVINSRRWRSAFHQRKAQSIIQEGRTSAQRLAHLIGVFSSLTPAVLPVPLDYRGLHNLKRQALRQEGYDTVLPLSEEVQDDLHWWIYHIREMNGQPILRGQSSLEIGTDASLEGWGAHCQRGSIGGPWTQEERSLHIYCTELLGALYAVQVFAKERREVSIHLKMDSSTAIAYINHLGGTRSAQLCNIAKELVPHKENVFGCFHVRRAFRTPGPISYPGQ